MKWIDAEHKADRVVEMVREKMASGIPKGCHVSNPMVRMRILGIVHRAMRRVYGDNLPRCPCGCVFDHYVEYADEYGYKNRIDIGVRCSDPKCDIKIVPDWRADTCPKCDGWTDDVDDPPDWYDPTQGDIRYCKHCDSYMTIKEKDL